MVLRRFPSTVPLSDLAVAVDVTALHFARNHPPTSVNVQSRRDNNSVQTNKRRCFLLFFNLCSAVLWTGCVMTEMASIIKVLAVGCVCHVTHSVAAVHANQPANQPTNHHHDVPTNRRPPHPPPPLRWRRNTAAFHLEFLRVLIFNGPPVLLMFERMNRRCCCL